MSEENKSSFTRKDVTHTRLQSLNEHGTIMVVARAYGADGEDLIDHQGVHFSGEPGVKLRVKQGDIVEDVVLSPFYGDASKKSSQAFAHGEPCELFSPESGVPLDRIPGMQSEDGGGYYAVYLTPKLAGGELVAISNIWGNTKSQMLSEREVLLLLADRQGQRDGSEPEKS